jgi:hypothetical protein
MPEILTLGGKGSGDFGHKGRPGEKGGSEEQSHRVGDTVRVPASESKSGEAVMGKVVKISTDHYGPKYHVEGKSGQSLGTHRGADLEKVGKRTMEDFRDLHLLRATGSPRSEMVDGRVHLVVPCVALMETVVHAVNSKIPEMVPLETLKKAADSWEGKPVLLGHPMIEGKQVPASTPGVFESVGLGVIRNPRVEGNKLHMDAWMDPVLVEKIGGTQFLESIRAGKDHIEVSVGAYVHAEDGEGEFGGKKFKATWRGTQGDHLAILPNSRGACSVAAGCGTHRAAERYVAAEEFRSATDEELETLGDKPGHDFHGNQYSGSMGALKTTPRPRDPGSVLKTWHKHDVHVGDTHIGTVSTTGGGLWQAQHVSGGAYPKGYFSSSKVAADALAGYHERKSKRSAESNEDSEEAELLETLGGKGSGDFDHRGRPGEKGGSSRSDPAGGAFYDRRRYEGGTYYDRPKGGTFGTSAHDEAAAKAHERAASLHEEAAKKFSGTGGTNAAIMKGQAALRATKNADMLMRRSSHLDLAAAKKAGDHAFSASIIQLRNDYSGEHLKAAQAHREAAKQLRAGRGKFRTSEENIDPTKDYELIEMTDEEDLTILLGKRDSQKDVEIIQNVHDHACALGAKCGKMAEEFDDVDIQVLGGPGSGDFQHGGRPGEVGGSGGGSSSGADPQLVSSLGKHANILADLVANSSNPSDKAIALSKKIDAVHQHAKFGKAYKGSGGSGEFSKADANEARKLMDEAKMLIPKKYHSRLMEEFAKPVYLSASLKDESLDARMSAVASAVYTAYNRSEPATPMPYTSVQAVYDDHVIIVRDGHLYSVDYSVDKDGTVSLGSKMTEVKQAYVAAEEQPVSTIQLEGGRWTLFSRDLTRRLGQHSTREEAEAQEQAIARSLARQQGTCGCGGKH